MAVLCAAGLSCDQYNPPPAPRAKPKVTLESVLYLRANSRTLLSPGSGGVVYVAQVVDDAQQRVLMIDNAGRPRETPLSGPRIAEALQITDGRAGIRAMTTLRTGEIVLYASGITRQRSLASLWLYTPSTDTLRLIADDTALGEASGMGASIDLADATLVRAGRSVWLALRHVDATRCLQLDTRELSSTGTARLSRPFEQIRSNEGAGGAVRIRADDVIFGREDGTLWLLQRTEGVTWRISGDGRLFPTESQPLDRPRMPVPPLDLTNPSLVANPALVRQLLFLPNEEQKVDSFAAPVIDGKQVRRYPVFDITGPRPASLDRDAISVRPAFPAHALRITNWCIEPFSLAIYAYDEMSGEVLRVQLSGV